MNKQDRKIKPQKQQSQTWDDYDEEDKIDTPVKLLKFIDWVFELANTLKVGAKRVAFWKKYYNEASAYAAELRQENPNLTIIPEPTKNYMEDLRILRIWCINCERPQDADVKWTHPMSLKEIAKALDVHTNTARKWLREGNLYNRQISPRRWCMAEYELPQKR